MTLGMSTNGIFKAGDMYKGNIGLSLLVKKVTPVELLMRIASEVTGQIFSHKSIDRQAYANLGFPRSDDISPTCLNNMRHAKTKEIQEKFYV